MARAFRISFCVVLAICFLGKAFGAPAPMGSPLERRDQYRPYRNVAGTKEPVGATSSTTDDPFFDDDDDEDFNFTPSSSSSSGGGSNIFSLLNLASALFPGSSSTNYTVVRDIIRQYVQNQQRNIRKKDVEDNIIEVDHIKKITPTLERQEEDDDDDDDDDSDSESEETNDAAEVSVEAKEDNNDKASQQDSNGDSGSKDNGSDYDEPEGDGQGGGVLGLLAGLSGGEEGSDLGTLLATVSQIVGDLSGDGFDLNALLTSGFGLFVGLLSQGEENPGEVISSYLLTSLDTITGGGAQNNGAFFGRFISTLLKGVSAAEAESGESSEEGKPVMADSAGFFISLLMSLSGDMSKGSSGGSAHLS